MPQAVSEAHAERIERLRRFNAVMGLLHLVQGSAMLLLSSDFSLPITASFLGFDEASNQLIPEPRTLLEVRIGPLVATFLFLSAIAHLVLVAPRVNAWYAENLRRGINYARWIEYSVSASLMIVVIAMLVGIYDIAALIALFAINAAMIGFGLMFEIHSQDAPRTNWTAFWLGCAAGAAPWIAIGIYLFATPGVPTFVYWIYGSIFVFFNAFAINMYLQYRRIGRWRDYAFGERAYIWLSLVAKSLLAWQVFAGTLRPN
jgi:hypothetical protein